MTHIRRNLKKVQARNAIVERHAAAVDQRTSPKLSRFKIIGGLALAAAPAGFLISHIAGAATGGWIAQTPTITEPVAQPTAVVGGHEFYGPEQTAATADGYDPVSEPIGRAVDVTVWGETSVTYSDNVDLAPKGEEESDFIGTVAAGIGVSGGNERVSGSIDYGVGYDHSFTTGENGDFRHDLTGYGEAAIVPNLLYLDAQGSISEIYYNEDDRFSANPTAAADDRSRVYYGSISPALRRNIGGWATAELRYRHSRTFFEDDDFADNYTNVYSASVASDPRRFTSFGWTAAGALTDAGDEDTNENTRQWNGSLSVAVPITRGVAVTATAGYDRFENLNYDDDLDGAYGNVGLNLTPGPRLQAHAYAGYRYSGLDYGLSLNYALAKRLALAVSAGRTVEFSDYGGAPVKLFGAGVDENGKPLFRSAYGGTTTNIQEALAENLLSGAQGAFGDSRISDLDNDAVVDSLTLAIAGETGRFRYGAAAVAQRRDYGRGIPDETSISGSLYGEYALSERLSLDASASLAHFNVEGDGNGVEDSNTISVGVGASYRITEIINAFARYTYTQRFADDRQDEYRENAAVVGLRIEL